MIVKLASGFLHDPIRVEVDRQSTTVEAIEQRVMFVAKVDKKRLLRALPKEDDSIESAIVLYPDQAARRQPGGERTR